MTVISEEQSQLTAVEKFGFKHDTQQLPKGLKQYKELIPKNGPGPAQQYAFEVNLDQCTGCKACVTACHNENGLEEDETWRSVGVIQGGTTQQPMIQHVTSACHHCLEPACMSGCPVKAYEKDPETGIVKHLDDQCIGCQYCMLTCPYDVPKYNPQKGIVHKCDMCIGRLKAGEAPACVRACPNEAIRITVIDKVTVRSLPGDFVNLPDTPDPRYTFPTTRYQTKRKFPINMTSLDHYVVKPEHSHLPLVFMLVLTQLSVGTFFIEFILKRYIDVNLRNDLLPFYVLIALGAGILALGVSVLHLGRPRYAFRSILGLKTSWLSREILAFALFALFASVYALCTWIDPLRGYLNVLGSMVFMSGLSGIICSVKVYQDTHRPFWDSHLTTFKFFMTTIILGVATFLLTSLIFSINSYSISPTYIMRSFGQIFCLILTGMTSIKLLVESTIFFHLSYQELTFAKKTAILLTRELKEITLLRFMCGILGGIVLPLFLFNHSMPIFNLLSLTFLIFLLCSIGEFLERFLFFKAVVPLKMPGGAVS